MKVYTAVEELQKNIRLSNVVWIDEKFIRVNKCELVVKNNGLNYRGVSRNQVCIACATDIFGNRFTIVAGNGHITSKQCIDTYGKHIEKGTTIIHDGIFSHAKLITYLNAKSIVYKSIGIQAHKGLQKINSFLAEIEHFIVVHPGIRTEYLQKYMSWIAFKSTIKADNM